MLFASKQKILFKALKDADMGYKLGGEISEGTPAYFREPFGYARLNPHIGHRHHLCALSESGECTLEEYKALVKNPKFICKKCGRAAANEDNLCEPVPL